MKVFREKLGANLETGLSERWLSQCFMGLGRPWKSLMAAQGAVNFRGITADRKSGGRTRVISEVACSAGCWLRVNNQFSIMCHVTGAIYPGYWKRQHVADPWTSLCFSFVRFFFCKRIIDWNVANVYEMFNLRLSPFAVECCKWKLCCRLFCLSECCKWKRARIKPEFYITISLWNFIS